MAENRSLCGYLVYRPGGPFGRLKSAKRQYYYLDDSQCTLYYYQSEEECRQRWRFPMGSIFIGEAAIALSNEDSLQFAIHSEGKEHILRAESHRNMMTWALGLQAERDSWEKKRILEPDGDETQLRLSANDAPKKAPSEDWRSSFGGKKALQLNGKAQSILRRMSIARVNLSSNSPSSGPLFPAARERRRQSTFAEIGFLRSSDPPRRRCIPEDAGGAGDILEENRSSSQPSLSPSDFKTASALCLTHQEEKRSSQTDDQTLSVPEGEKEIRDKESETVSPETESASESDQLLLDEDDVDDQSPKCQVPILRPSQQDCTASSPVRPQSFCFQFESIDDSTRASQTDELLEVKCELAKCLNKESANRTALEQKERALRELREKLRQTTELQNSRKEEKLKEMERLQEKNSMLQSQIKFLNDEILKLSRMLQLEQFKSHSKQLSIQEHRSNIDQMKRDYVFLLQCCIRISCTDGSEKMELYMYGEKRHKQRVFALLEEARKTNSSLPNIEAMTTSLCHIDYLGFKHIFVDKSLILHYVCRQLHHHYTTLLRSYALHVIQWKKYAKRHLADPRQQYLQPTPELKSLVRGGIPEQMRSRVWCALYRTKVKDIRESKGPNYYSKLCSMATESESVQHLEQHKRQVCLDLLRTMPNNINFCDRNSEGIKKMQDILNAFCLHNPSLGYCQGMNFLVGMTLLFMDAEDAFWCLVAIVERYFTPSYFDQNLIGAQADQEVLKDLLKTKLPKISSHLAELDIELSTITLNWILSIFIDSVPLETLLRIWDCFLLEGPKVLFRFSLAILKLQEEAILAKHDTVSIMRQLKAAAKLCFDVECLVSTAFEDLEPFPSRQEISAKQSSFFNVLLEKAKKKEREHQALRERERMMAQVELEGTHNHLIECAAVWGRDKVWVCHGHHHGSRVSMVNCQDNIMYRLHIEFESRVMCMHVPNDDTMLFGTFSHFVHAYHTISRKKMWEIFLNASVLSLSSHQRDGVKQVFAGLADGTLAVVENVQGRIPKPEVFYVVIGSNPVTCLQLVGRKLWCACGSNVAILSARTLDLLDQFQTSSNGLDYIFRMVCGDQGIWISLRGSSILQLWDPHTLTCRLLYDVRDDYCSRSTKVDEAYTNHARVTSVLPFDNTILVGTADGTLVIYDTIAKKSPGQSGHSSPRPQQSQSSETSETNAKQIQERLQKLFMEQEMMESDRRSSTASPNLTPMSNVSRRESSSEASASTNPEGEVLPSIEETEVSKILLSSPKKLEDMEEEDEEDNGDEKLLSENAKNMAELKVANLDTSMTTERNKSFYVKGFRKSSFTISTPIAEENVNSFFQEDEEISWKTKADETTPPTVISQKDPIFNSQQYELKQDPPKTESEDLDAKNLNRFSQVTAGDLLSTDLTLRPRSRLANDDLVSALDCRNIGFDLKKTKNKYQSLSAEDIPSWVAQEKPQPIISDKGDVTFAYKSKLPSIKAFIKKEALELSNFLKSSGALEKLGSDIDKTMAEEKSEMDQAARRRIFSGPFFSIRPPTIDLADSQMWSPGLIPPDEIPTDNAIEITVDGSEDQSQLPDSRRSSASVQSLIQDEIMPPMAGFMVNDDDFLSAAQFNDLLQLQDWTRTSRKGSDTASNVSFGSNEVPFAFELTLKEKIKISDKPIRTLLLASCNDEPIIISCAGYYGDDEAVLKWMKEGDEKLWTNDPVIEVCPYTHTIKPSPYARSRMPRRASIATTAISGQSELDNTFGRSVRSSSTPSPAASAGILMESGLAKVQHLLSRVSERT